MNAVQQLNLRQQVDFPLPLPSMVTWSGGETRFDQPIIKYRREIVKSSLPPAENIAETAIVSAISANSAVSTSTSSSIVVTYSDPFEFDAPRPTAIESLSRVRRFLAHGQLSEARLFLETAVRNFPADAALNTLAKIVSRDKAKLMPAKFPRRDLDYQWLKANREQYVGKWVALLSGNLLAVGDSMQEILSEVQARKIQDAPLVHKVE